MRWFGLVVVSAMLAAACSPGTGPESIPLPTSPDTTTSTTTTTTSTTTTTVPEGPTTTEVPSRFRARIQRTTDGVAHVTADDLASMAFGQGWVSGEDHGCTLIDQVLKVRGERSASLGPGENGENIESDFAWRAIGIFDRAAADFDDAPSDVVESFESFATGWNAHLDEVGSEGLNGWCAGADWVRRVQPVEVYAYARSTALLASSARLADLIPGARPPGSESETVGVGGERPEGGDPAAVTTLAPFAEESTQGSNAWAVGRDRTEGGVGGLLVANPHFPWEGELRFHEIHLTVPGEIDIYGAQLLGLPGVGIGFTDGVAWSHTVSAGHRFTAYLLSLDPSSPTSYLVDGESIPMTSAVYEIEILRPDGSVDVESRTLWNSEYGPIIDFPGIGWTDSSALTFRDTNLDNEEYIEQYLDMVDVTDLDDLIATHRAHQGVPQFNTIATGRDGEVWYADSSAAPNLSPEGELLFAARLLDDPLTQLAWESGVMLLDGSDSRLRWEVQEGARDPGLVPWDELPQVRRSDYVFNANDSYWVPSAEFTLDGAYSIVHGEAGIPQSMRTRRNASVLNAANPTGLAGDDGMFSGPELRDAVFDNASQSAFLLRPTLVAACRAQPLVELPEVLGDDGAVALPAATVDLTDACEVTAGWDGRYDLDRAGPLLWRETMSRFNDDERTNPGPLFADPFDPARPTTSPSVPADPAPLLAAFARAVQVVGIAGFTVDATLGSAQFTERSGERIALHGGTGTDGVTNVVAWSDGLGSSAEPAPVRGEAVAPGSSLRGSGYPVNTGTSFVMTVDYSDGSPRAWAMLTYGETGDRTDELFSQQTLRFSEKNWREVAFTQDQIEADPAFTERIVERD